MQLKKKGGLKEAMGLQEEMTFSRHKSLRATSKERVQWLRLLDGSYLMAFAAYVVCR